MASIAPAAVRAQRVERLLAARGELVAALAAVGVRDRHRDQLLAQQLADDAGHRRRAALAVAGEQRRHEVLAGDALEHLPLRLGEARALGELRAALAEQVRQALQPADGLVNIRICAVRAFMQANS